MGAVSGLLGVGGGAGGTGFAGPAQASIVSPATAQQATDQYNNANAGLNNQQQFLTALQAQNGIGNQSDVYNQLQGVTNGTGPNPAQAQLAQATGANVANQAALMAGQRGAGANTGLIARQAAMQGANTQQQAANQAATLQANQSLNALTAQGNLAGQQVANQAAATNAYTGSAQQEQSNILNSIAGQNQSAVSSQNSVNSANAGLAGQGMQNQAGAIGGLANAGIGGISQLMKAEGGKINRQQYAFGTPPGQYVQAPPMSDAQWNAASAVQPQMPQAAPAAPQAVQPQMVQGGQPQQPQAPQPAAPNFGNPGANALYKGLSAFGQFLNKPKKQDVYGQNDEQIEQNYLDADKALNTKFDPNNNADMAAANDPDTMRAAKGGKVPALVSPGEKYLKPQDVDKVKQGANPMSVGETIPGKPVVGGAKNSYANDTVPKNLDEGGIVIPRSITQGKNPHWGAMKFVQAHMAKGGLVPPVKPKKGKK